MYSAASTTPNAATTAAALCAPNVPTSTRNSLTNVDRPGSDSADRPATRNVPASTGTTFCRPPWSAIRALPVRAMRKPATRNSAPVESPWLSMYRLAPCTLTEVNAKMPSTMKPKWLTEV